MTNGSLRSPLLRAQTTYVAREKGLVTNVLLYLCPDATFVRSASASVSATLTKPYQPSSAKNTSKGRAVVIRDFGGLLGLRHGETERRFSQDKDMGIKDQVEALLV